MSTTGLMLHQNGSSLDKSDGPSLIISGRNEYSASSLKDEGSVSKSRPINEDSISFLGLPYHIWKKIFRFAGVICPCHIALVPTRLENLRSSSRRLRQKSSKKHRPISTNLVTCAFRKIPEFDDGSCYKHIINVSMLEVSRMARFITLKTLLQEGSFHFELRNAEDVDALDQTLRGFDFMSPLNGELQRLHLKLVYSVGRPKTEYLAVWYYFCDWFGKHLKVSLIRFGLECRPGSVEIAEEIMASKAISSFKGLETCYVLFDSRSPKLSRRYARLSEQFVGEVAFERTGLFRFMELPIEIQMIILHYVLVTDQVIFRGDRSWVCSMPTRKRLGNGKNGQSHSCCMCSFLKHQETLTRDTACSCLWKRSETVRHLFYPENPVDMSPVGVFRTNKHFHALGGSIFYSRNKFKFDTKELLSFCNYQRPYVTLGFPKRHIGRVRHLHIKLVAGYFSDDKLKEYERLAELLKEAFERTSIDLTVGQESEEWLLDLKVRRKLLSLFDHFEGERPEIL